MIKIGEIKRLNTLNFYIWGIEMKAYYKAFIISILIISLFLVGCSSKEIEKKKIVIGVVMGKFDDTWRTSVRNELYKMSQDKAEVDIWSGNNSQETENEKVDLLIKRKVNVLVVNLVDLAGADSIIEKAKKANIPIIFFNTEPSSENLKKWDKVYYVGAKGQQSGTMEGQILVNYFKNHPTKDGIIRYVMLEGQTEHPDATARTKYSVKAMEDAGLNIQKVGDEVATWEREKAQEKMENLLASQGDNIDCIIANNDDMALGAIDALKNRGYFSNGKYIPVAGVDANNSALNAEQEGTLLGTVLNDAVNQGKAIFNLASVLAVGQSPNKDNFNGQITDNKYVWIDYKIITKENIGEAK
jgi:ABC-type sugar transport system, periplasmic component